MLNSFTFYLWYNLFHDIYYDIYSYDIFREQIFNTILIWVIIWWQSRLKKKYIFSTTSKCFKNECQTYKKNSSKFQIVIWLQVNCLFFF